MIAGKATGLQFETESWWEYFPGQKTFIDALVNLTEVSKGKAQLHSGKKGNILSAGSALYNRKMADLCPKIGTFNLYYTATVLYRAVQYYFRAPWLWINMFFLHRFFPGRLSNLRLDSRISAPLSFHSDLQDKSLKIKSTIKYLN